MELISIIISGIVSGGLYALTALGLVLSYRTSGVLNFAFGGIGGFAAYSAFALLGLHLPYFVAVLVALLVGAALGALTDLAVCRPLRDSNPLTVGIGTMGLLLIFQGAIASIWGTNVQSLPLPFSSLFALHLGEVSVGSSSLFILLVTGLAVLAAVRLVLGTSFGLAMRATSAGPMTASLLGIDTAAIRLATWSLSGACGALAALFVTARVQLDPTIFTQFILSTFAAVVLGGFTSLGGVLAGGIAFGVIINIVAAYVTTGFIKSTTFAVIVLVLMLRPHGLFGRPELKVGEPPIRDFTRSNIVGQRGEGHGSGASPLLRWAGYLALLAGFLAMPFLLPAGSYQIYRLASAIASFLAILGLNVLSGHSGQLSLGHSAFMAVGAYVAAVATTYWGWPLWAALLFATSASAALGVAIGLPATRLSGLYLALLTLAFGWTVPEVLLKLSVVGGASGMLYKVPAWLADDLPKYWLVLGMAALATCITLALELSTVGRRWRAVRDSELGARSIGLNIAMVKLSAFGWSAALAGLSGALTGVLVGFISPEIYNVWIAVYLLLGGVIGGSGSTIGSVIGALFITYVPAYAGDFHLSPDVVYGTVLLALLVLSPEGLAALPSMILRRFGRSPVTPTTART
ncbi:MAG: ABC transporter permease [Rhodospirillales bacterium]|nr:ABC transporter permease [Rhodospirillales bacterium]